MYKKLMVLGFMATTSLCAVMPAQAETLQETVQHALSAHPSIEGALASKDAAEQSKKEARSNLFPFVSAATSVGRLYADNSTSRGLTVTRGSASSGLWEANASVTQPVFDGMQTKNRIEAANARMQSADYNVLDIRESLALRATQVHIGVLQAQATLDRTQSYFEAIEGYLERIQLMVDEGVADETEVTQARNISLMLKSALTDYQGQLETAIANYREVVGHVPRSSLQRPLNITTLADDVTTAISAAQDSHPLLMANEKEMEALGYDIKAEKGSIYPGLDAEFSGIHREQREVIGGELTDVRAVLTLNWDFEVGGASQARGNRSQAEYAEIVAQNKEQLRVIEGDIRRAYTELETAKKQVDLVKQREVVTSDLLKAYQTQFEGARVRLLQLMQSENQLFNSQLETIAAEYRYLFAQYNVLASTGKLQQVVNGGLIATQPAPNQEIATVSEEVVSKQVDIVPKLSEVLEISESKAPTESIIPSPVFEEETIMPAVAPKQAVILDRTSETPTPPVYKPRISKSSNFQSERTYITIK